MDRDAMAEDLEHLEQEFDHEETHLPEVALEVAVAELHMRNHETIAADASIQDAMEVMLEVNVGCLPIVDDGKLVGIVTERNVLRKVAPDFVDLGSRTVREIMVANPTFIRMDATVATAIRLMHDGRFRHLPILDADGRVTGTLSVRNIVEYLIDHFPVEVLNLPPTPVERQPMQTREGA